MLFNIRNYYILLTKFTFNDLSTTGTHEPANLFAFSVSTLPFKINKLFLFAFCGNCHNLSPCISPTLHGILPVSSCLPALLSSIRIFVKEPYLLFLLMLQFEVNYHLPLLTALMFQTS